MHADFLNKKSVHVCVCVFTLCSTSDSGLLCWNVVSHPLYGCEINGCSTYVQYVHTCTYRYYRSVISLQECCVHMMYTLCLYTYTYTYTYIHIHVHVHTHVMYIYTCTCTIHIHIHVHVHTHTRTHTHTCNVHIHMHMHNTHTHTRTRTYTYTYTYTHM